jgi:GT2 family glycosyltransferase
MGEGNRMTGVAIVIVNYGSSDLLEQNLASLTRDQPELTAVVVDNFTTEAERKRLVALASQEGWRTVLPATNTGFGGGMNLGVAAALSAGADRLLLLNPDAVIDPGSVELLREESMARPDALLAPRILRPDGSLWFAGSDLYLSDGRIRSRRRRIEGAAVEPWLSGACLMLSADLWQRVGGFDEEYFLYWEDIDLCRRVRETGGALDLVEAATAVHAQGGTQGSAGAASSGEAKSATYYYYNIRNRLLFACRHLSTPAVIAWRRQSLPIMWEVLLQGGRRQFLRRPSTLVVGLRAVRDGRRLVRDELARRARA